MSNELQQIEAILSQGLQTLQLDLPLDGFVHYLQLLHKWNHAYNLTAIRDQKTMVSRHLLDSLAIIPWIKGARVIDVGSGAGLPGIPLALAMPEAHIVLVDSNGKKIRFLQEVCRALSLTNVEVHQTRVENYHPTQGFDTVISRAFSELDQMIHWTRHLLSPQGIWLAMKGRYPEMELTNLQYPSRVESYQVMGIDGERCCVIIDNKS
jgi:16S rRNA (guanine527-N7)-methyltransferase